MLLLLNKNSPSRHWCT